MIENGGFQRADFAIEALENVSFQGFTRGESWNGWACPYFSHDTARAVLAASEQNGYSWCYDGDADAFFVRHADDPEGFAEKFSALKAAIDGQDTALYAIGAYSWAWVAC